MAKGIPSKRNVPKKISKKKVLSSKLIGKKQPKLLKKVNNKRKSGKSSGCSSS